MSISAFVAVKLFFEPIKNTVYISLYHLRNMKKMPAVHYLILNIHAMKKGKTRADMLL